MTPPLNPAPTMTVPQAMPKKKGCGCCLWGCFGLGMVAILLIIGSYIGIRYATYFVLSDSAARWAYTSYARPKIMTMLPPNWSEAQKTQVMGQADQAFEEFLALPPEEKAEMKKEAVTALYYYSQNQMIPPEKIPHLQPFIEKQINRFQNLPPTNSPNLMQ